MKAMESQTVSDKSERSAVRKETERQALSVYVVALVVFSLLMLSCSEWPSHLFRYATQFSGALAFVALCVVIFTVFTENRN